MIEFFLGLFAGTAAKQAGREFEAWAPRIARSIAKYAASRLEASDRERYDEEWQAYLHDVPGEIGKIVVAIGFLLATRQMRNQPALIEVIIDKFFAFLMLSSISPLILLIIAILLVDDPRKSPFVKKKMRWIDGQEFRCLVFRRGSRFDRMLTRTDMRQLPFLVSAISGDLRFNLRRNWRIYLTAGVSLLGKGPPPPSS